MLVRSTLRLKLGGAAGTYPSQSNWSRDRRVGLSAIGQCLKDQYDALVTPIPPHLAALVKQLEEQGGVSCI